MRLQIIVILIIVSSFMIPNFAKAESISEIYKLTVDNNVYHIPYTITNGKLNDMTIYYEGFSLVVSIESSDIGTITLEIPRELFQMVKDNCEYENFIVLVDNKEIQSFEQRGTITETILTIPFQKGNSEIEAVGTMVPETPQYWERCKEKIQDEWKIQNTTLGEQTFKIPYKITSGTANIMMDYESLSIVALLSNDKEGALDIIIPRNLLDATTTSGQDDAFIVLVNGRESEYEEEKSVCFRELLINFPPQSKNIEILITFIYQPPRTTVAPVYVYTDKNNYKSGELVTISGCTNLALDYKEVILDILNPDGKTYDVVSVPTKPDGTFTYSFQASGELGIDGNYTVNASYGDNVTSHTFTIPEFPTVLLLLTLSFILIIFLSKPRILTRTRKRHW